MEKVGADAGDGDGFEAEVVDAAIDDGAHGFGDVRHGRILTTDYTDGHGFFYHRERKERKAISDFWVRAPADETS